MTALEMWVVYDRPKDYPKHIVSRKWIFSHGKTVMTESMLIARDLKGIRIKMVRQGLTKIDRFEYDDSKIVEVWL